MTSHATNLVPPLNRRRNAGYVMLVIWAGIWLPAPAAAAPFGLTDYGADIRRHGGDLRQRIAVFGKDNRTTAPAKYRSAAQGVGLLYNPTSHTLCTAFCTARNVVATAAHCLFRRTNWGAQPLSGFVFKINSAGTHQQSRIAGRQRGTVMQNVIAGTTHLRVRPPIDAASDWALVRLEQPVCKGHVLKMRALSNDAMIRASLKKQIFQISYHRDYKNWELAYSPNCSISRRFENLRWSTIRQEFSNPQNLILHRCDTAGASSGSPLLFDARDGSDPVVIGINVGTYVQSHGHPSSAGTIQDLQSHTIANTGVSVSAFADLTDVLQDAQVLSSRGAIRQIQTRLRELNLYGGPVDGQFGNMTRNAIRAYERSSSQRATGLPTQRLLGALGTPPPLPFQKPGRTLEQPQARASITGFALDY